MKTKAIAGIITLFLAILMAFNVMPASAQPINIVVNGSFEQPEVTTTELWDIYTSGEIDGWNVEWMPTVPETWSSYTRPSPHIELQEEPLMGWSTPYGDQWAELDSDWFGVVGPSGEPASIAICQDLPTMPGGSYELSFAYSPRPNVADNHLKVKWGGTVVADITASGGSTVQWTTPTYTVTATSSTTELRFEEAGPHDSLGMFLDDVSVTPEFIEVSIDIKPGSFPNSINLGDQGLLPVAILGSETFDVITIDAQTIEIGGVDLASRGSPKAPKLAYSYEDVNGDANMDLVTFFEVQMLVEAGVLTETTVALTLTATLFDGTPIIGTDSVRVVPP